MSFHPDSFSSSEFSRLSDTEVEQIFIAQQKKNLHLRAPGKYDKLAVVDFLSNFNPLSKLLKTIPQSGGGAFPALEISYHFGRAVDDIADGDVPLPAGYNSYAQWSEMLKKTAETKGQLVKKSPSVEFLLKRIFERFEKIPTPIDLPTQVIAFLKAMEREHERRVNKLVLSTKELEILNRDSFGSPHTITLAALKQNTQAEDIWELSQVQGRVQALRDLQSELTRGICNIPAEVLSSSGLSFAELEINPSLLESNQTIQSWIVNECEECDSLLEQLQTKTPAFSPTTKLYLKFLVNGMEKRIQELSRNF